MNNFCRGDFKNTKDTSLDAKNGFSTAHLKGMYAQSKPVSIKGHSKEFDQMVIDHTKGTSISGVQRKIFMRLENNLLLPCNQGQYIVKPAPRNLPELPANEHAIMKIAERLKLNVAKCSVAPFENGELAYITKRFDLTDKAGVKLFIEDGASICDVHPKNKANSDALSYETCLQTMAKACGGATAIAAQGAKIVLFSYLVGNNDLHLKNFSLQRSPTNRSHIMESFSPFYDLLSVAPYPVYDSEYTSLSILESETDNIFTSSYNAYGYYTQHDFILLFNLLGVPNPVAKKIILQLGTNLIKTAREVLPASHLSTGTQAIILKRITERLTALQKTEIYD